MRIRFYISTYDPNRWSDDVTASDSTGHNAYINTRHWHENYSLKEIFRDEYRGVCVENHSQETRTMLIDIPDDIGFQFMMQGIQDDDYLVYNVYTEKYVFGTDLDHTDDATRSDGMNGSGKAWGSNLNKDKLMFDWEFEEFVGNKRPLITIPVEDAFYTNLDEYCKPIIEHWAYTKYYLICSDLNTVLHKKEKESSSYVQVQSSSPVPEEHEERRPFVQIGMDALNFLFFQYVNDGDMFLAVKDRLYPYQLEFYRRMYVHVHRKSTEAQ